MKYSTIVIAALFGYIQAARIQAKDDGDLELPGQTRRSPFSKDDSDSESDSSDSNPWPQEEESGKMFGGSDGKKKGNGKGVIVSAEAGANSFQGQSVKVLPDTVTKTIGESSCWASNHENEDGSFETQSEKTFKIDGEIKVIETTSGMNWSKAEGTSDGSAQKAGQQSVFVKDSDYCGKLSDGAVCSCTCEQDDIDKKSIAH